MTTQVRDREVLRRWESNENERHRLSLEEKVRKEDEKLQRIRGEREEMRELAQMRRASRRLEEEKLRKQMEVEAIHKSYRGSQQEEEDKYALS